MLLILLYLGTNKGAFLSYHLTLLLPSLLITGSNEINNFCIRYTSTKQTLFKLIMCIVSLLLLIKKYEFPYVYTKEIQAQYSLIENTLSQYDKQTIYLVPQLGYYAYDTQIELAENGHEEYIITLSDSKVIKNPINIDKEARIYPYLSTLYAYSVNRKAEISELIDNQAFSLITRTNGATTLWGYDLCNNYICIESLPIRTGNQNTIIDFWIPKTSSP
ncbi:MAG: hypothetical protein UFG06_11580 [Lachnospiraceae bacterium]|nr:hypothetical protein [Lachnospiraceae bacterium]